MFIFSGEKEDMGCVIEAEPVFQNSVKVSNSFYMTLQS